MRIASRSLRVAAVAGGLSLLVAGTAASDAATATGTRTVTVVVHFSRYEPSSIQVRPGETVRFVVRNTDPIDHEFILGDEEVQRIHEEGTEAHHGEKPGEISVPAGATVSTTYTFPDQPGSLIFACHLPGHFDYGMRGTVTFG